MLQALGERKLWWCREEVCIQPWHPAVSHVSLQRLWWKREQLQKSQRMFSQMCSAQKGYVIYSFNPNTFQSLLFNSNTLEVITLSALWSFCSSGDEDDQDKEEKPGHHSALCLNTLHWPRAICIYVHTLFVAFLKSVIENALCESFLLKVCKLFLWHIIVEKLLIS